MQYNHLSNITNKVVKSSTLSVIENYNKAEPIHKKQVEFHKCKKRNKWVFGGNRSGKTECGAVEVVYLARGIHPYIENIDGVTGWCVSLTKQVQRDVSQNKILHYLKKEWIKEIVMCSGKSDSPEYGIIDFIVIENIFGGESKIGFRSCDQGREKFQGVSLDFVWFDEEPPYDIYQECLMRVLDRKGRIFGTMTPLKGLTWVYNEIYLNENNNDEVAYFCMEWSDNPYLSKDEIAQMSQNLSETELDSRRYGKFMDYGGLVYPEFDENENVIEPFNVPEDWQETFSIDPGLNNPLSCHFYARDYDGNVYVIAEHFEAKKDVEYHAKAIKKLAKTLNWHYGHNGMLCGLIDSAGAQRTLSSLKSVVDLFYEQGILLNPKVDKDMFSGISKVKSYIKNAEGKRRLFIFKNCVNLIREIKSYFWSEGDNPIKRDDHALDELRYYIMSINSDKKAKSTKSIVMRDKQKLTKNIRNF